MITPFWLSSVKIELTIFSLKYMHSYILLSTKFFIFYNIFSFLKTQRQNNVENKYSKQQNELFL